MFAKFWLHLKIASPRLFFGCLSAMHFYNSKVTLNLPAALKQTIASIFVWLQFVWVYISYPEYLPQFIDAFNSIFQGIFTLSFFFSLRYIHSNSIRWNGSRILWCSIQWYCWYFCHDYYERSFVYTSFELPLKCKYLIFPFRCKHIAGYKVNEMLKTWHFWLIASHFLKLNWTNCLDITKHIGIAPQQFSKDAVMSETFKFGNVE